MNLRVQRMSRGTRQKLGLVLALAHKPRLLILDEPTSALDPLMQQELAGCLRELAAQGHTIFFSSHTLSEVESLCDRVAIVRQGRIVADETLESLRSRAPRTVELVYRDEGTSANTEPPHGLRPFRRQGRTWHCELDGPAQPLIQWAAQQAIDDVCISPPDLENVFRKYYEGPLEPR
jgi:ABC-2 type transport system ATP-binding protein